MNKQASTDRSISGNKYLSETAVSNMHGPQGTGMEINTEWHE